MKKTVLMMGTALVLAFAVVSCGPDDNDDSTVVNPPAPAPGSSSMTLSGTVYEISDGDDFSLTFTPFPSGQSRTVESRGGTGTIANGQLNFTIETPTDLWSAESFLYDLPEGTTVTPSAGVMFSEIYSLGMYNSGEYSGSLYLGHGSGSIRGNSYSYNDVVRIHIYVSQDVVVRLANNVTENETEGSFTYNYVTRAFTLDLKRGWNAVYQRSEGSGTFQGSADEPTGGTITSTTTISTSDPGLQLRWAFWGNDDSYNSYSETSRRSVHPQNSIPFGTRR
jgi:hypothetical protein